MNTPLPADDLMSRLRTPANWLSQGGGSWKDTISRYDRTPYDAADEIEQLRGALKDLARAYVRLLESGRDRIISLGGDCDPVDVMERGDPYLRKANEAMAKGACKRLQQQVDALRHYCDPIHVALAYGALSAAGYSERDGSVSTQPTGDV